MEENKNNLETAETAPENVAANTEEQYSLNDDRRVKVLSPGRMVAKRFFRNRIAVVGLAILAFMFAFSFIGGLISPYQENQQFYRTDMMMKTYAGAVRNDELSYTENDTVSISVVQKARISGNLILYAHGERVNDTTNVYKTIAEGFYEVEDRNGTILAIAYYDRLSGVTEGQQLSFAFKYGALRAYNLDEDQFTADGVTYSVSEGGDITDPSGKDVAYISHFTVNQVNGEIISRDFSEAVSAAIERMEKDQPVTFTFTDEAGETLEYTIEYNSLNKFYDIKKATPTHVLDTYSWPSAQHWLGTDRNGMDMLTRLMYGGRVSLVIGFIVEFISLVIGVILGGIAGYFGKWVDNLIMRIVDIFYCIPSMPIIIILGAAMDGMQVDPQLRMVYLMLILGFLGWPGLARLIRGQILSLREQEFMTATEATGISVSRRIFRHLIPNVIPQLIVSCTMGLGGTILTEATLSFLGLGVKYPFASWGNIINDVNNTFVLTNYWFIWIPAGILLLLTVLAFNLVGDGLRDAFDPKMKR